MFTKLKSSKSRRMLKGGIEGPGGEEGPPALTLHSVIHDSLTYDNQFSEKDIWEGNKKMFYIINKLKGSLPLMTDGPRVKVNFPAHLPEFVGLASKSHQPNRLLPAATIVSDIIRRVRVDAGDYVLATLGRVIVPDHVTLGSLGLASLFDQWELDLIPKSTISQDPSLFVRIDNLDESEASLRLLVIVHYPPEFGGLAKSAHKLDIFTPVSKHISHLTMQKGVDPTQFTFKTLDGLTIDSDETLSAYGLGSRFPQWELAIVSKKDSPPPPVLHSKGLLWALVSDSVTFARDVSSIVTHFDEQVEEKAKEIEELGNSNEELKQTNEQYQLNIAQIQSQIKGLNETLALRDATEQRMEGEISELRKDLSSEKSQKEIIQSKVTSLEQSLALAEFTVNLMEDKRGKDEELAQLKRKFETEIETYKQLLETVQRSKIQVEIELEEKWKKESITREQMEKSVNIERAEWKREIEKWRIEKNDLYQKWTREKTSIESEVKKRKGLEIDKTRLEREILELQRRADRERIKREEVESRWTESGESTTAPAQVAPTSPSNAVTRFESSGQGLFEKLVGDEGAVDDDVAKKRLRIERGAYERELDTLRKENEFMKKELEQIKKERRRKSMDTEKGERMHNTLERHLGDTELKAELKVDARRKLSWDLDRDNNGVPTSPPHDSGRHVTIMDNSNISRRKSFGEKEEMPSDRDADWVGTDRTVEKRRWDMEREIEMEKWKKQAQQEKDHERFKWKLEKDKELDRLKKYHEMEKASVLKEKDQLRNEKDKYINELRTKLDEQVVKVRMWEEEVMELTKELKNRELDRLREAAKAERERSGKQFDEQEREIMRLKTILQGEKSEWYRLMDQEKAKWKLDRSNELEALQKEVDVRRAEIKSLEKAATMEKHRMEQERLRFQEDKLLWKKEIDAVEERARKKDAEIAKIRSDPLFDNKRDNFEEKPAQERPKIVRRASRDTLVESKPTVPIATEKSSPRQVRERQKETEAETEARKQVELKLTEELKQKEEELRVLVKSFDEERAVKMWEEEVEELEKSHRAERENEIKELKELHAKEIKKWERAAEEALARLNTEKSAELKTLKDAVKQKLAKQERRYRAQTEQLEGVQQKLAQQSLEYSILQGEHRIQGDELNALRDKYRKEMREWDVKWTTKEAETEKTQTQLRDEIAKVQTDAAELKQQMEEDVTRILAGFEATQIQLQTEIRRLETENFLLQQMAIKEKDNATLIARQWAEKERKAAEVEKRQWKKDEQKREEERNAREKDWISKLTAKFKEIEKIIDEDYVDIGGEETAERLLRRMEHVRMLLLADKKLKKKPKASAAGSLPSANATSNNISNNNNNNNNMNEQVQVTPYEAQLKEMKDAKEIPKESAGGENKIVGGPELPPFVFSQTAQPTITAADLLEKNLDTVLKQLSHSKANHKELATQVWDLRRQLNDARKYFDKTLHAIEEESNFNMQHLRRSYEEQLDGLKSEAKRANRMLEQALARHSATAPPSPAQPHTTVFAAAAANSTSTSTSHSTSCTTSTSTSTSAPSFCSPSSSSAPPTSPSPQVAATSLVNTASSSQPPSVALSPSPSPTPPYIPPNVDSNPPAQ